MESKELVSPSQEVASESSLVKSERREREIGSRDSSQSQSITFHDEEELGKYQLF
jgi:hypothetical protein